MVSFRNSKSLFPSIIELEVYQHDEIELKFYWSDFGKIAVNIQDTVFDFKTSTIAESKYNHISS